MDDDIVAIVEDDHAVRDAITLVLESEGWTVQAYPSGELFLAAFDRGPPPRCVLLDLMLPGISGADVAATVRARGVMVVGLTAYPHSEMTELVRTLGVQNVLTKPVATAVLVETLQACRGSR